MQPAALPRGDLVALSFVYGLSRELLYPVLKGEPVPDGAAARLPFPESPPATSLETFLTQVACPSDVVRVAAAARRDAARALQRAEDRNVRLTVWTDSDYPPLLTHIFDPPLVLWVRGSFPLGRAAVAVVGSRVASPYGEQAASRLGYELASRGVVVVSGMARGIDAAAHRGALSGAGATIAVLGCGPDVIYPPEHAALADEILRSGAILSEYPPGAPPTKWNFPRRNRIISGLARGVVIVEASQRSGALITANCALEQGREVMAVPGNVLSERHRGSHTLLKAGASLVESAQDVFDLLHIAGDAVVDPPVSPGARPLLAALDEDDARDLDSVAERVRMPIAELLPRLLELELQGFVRRMPGGRFLRASRIPAKGGGTGRETTVAQPQPRG
ncbi:MAG: DNA-processing protein DprA [Bacteroidales bacterium]